MNAEPQPGLASVSWQADEQCQQHVSGNAAASNAINSMLCSLQQPTHMRECVIMIRLNGCAVLVDHLCAAAPQLCGQLHYFLRC